MNFKLSFSSYRNIAGIGLASAIIGLLNQVIFAASLGTSSLLSFYLVFLSLLSLPMVLVQVLRDYFQSIIPGLLLSDKKKTAAHLSSSIVFVIFYGILATIIISGFVLIINSSANDELSLEYKYNFLLIFSPFVSLYFVATYSQGILNAIGEINYVNRDILLGKCLAIGAIASCIYTNNSKFLLLALFSYIPISWQVFSCFRRLNKLELIAIPRFDKVLYKACARTSQSILITYILASIYTIVEKITFANLDSSLVSAWGYGTSITNNLLAILITPLAQGMFSELVGRPFPQAFKAYVIDFIPRVKSVFIIFSGILFFLLLNSEQLIHVLFARGNFTQESANITSLAFNYCLVTQLPLGLYIIIQNIFLAQRNYGAIVIYSSISSVSSIGVLCISYLLNSVSIAFSASFVGCITSVLIFYIRNRESLKQAHALKDTLKILLLLFSELVVNKFPIIFKLHSQGSIFILSALFAITSIAFIFLGTRLQLLTISPFARKA